MRNTCPQASDPGILLMGPWLPSSQGRANWTAFRFPTTRDSTDSPFAVVLDGSQGPSNFRELALRFYLKQTRPFPSLSCDADIFSDEVTTWRRTHFLSFDLCLYLSPARPGRRLR